MDPIKISKKTVMEKRRLDGINKATKDIKHELIQRGYGTETDLKSQNDVLFCAAEVVAAVDLKHKYPADVPMKNLIEAVGKRKARAGRMQFRRIQKADALKNLKHFIMRNELGTVAQRSKHEHLQILQITLDYLKTLPNKQTVTPTPVLPSDPKLSVSSETDSTMVQTIAETGCPPPAVPKMVSSSPAAGQVDVAAQPKMFPFVAPSGTFELNQTALPIPFFPISPFLLPSVPVAPVWPMNPTALQMNFNFPNILQNMGYKLQPNQSSHSSPHENCSMDCENEDVDVLN